MKRTTKKLSKAEAARFFGSVIGSGSGIWEVTKGREYSIRNGQIVYAVGLVDNWPFGMRLQLTAFINDQQVIRKIDFDRDTYKPIDMEESK